MELSEPVRPPQEGILTAECQCGICLEKLQSDTEPVIALSCGHSFHGFSCLARHIRSRCQGAEDRIRSFLGERSAELGLGDSVRSDSHMGTLFEMRTRGQIRQCPSCGYGPVLNTACADMDSHDVTHGTGTGRVTNSCGSCGFHSSSWEDWAVWEPEDVSATVRCPICRAGCKVAEGQEERLRVMLEEEHGKLGLSSLMGACFKYIADSLDQLAVLRPARLAESAEDADALHMMRRETSDASFPHTLELLRKRLTMCEETEARGRSEGGTAAEMTQVGSEASEAAEAKLENMLTRAMAEVSKLIPIEQKYWKAVSAEVPDFMLCMEMSEHIVGDLNVVICPLVQRFQSVRETLKNKFKSWSSSSNRFTDVPSLDDLFEWLTVEFDLQISSKPSSKECSTQTEAEPCCAEDLDDDVIHACRHCADVLREGCSWSARDAPHRRQALALLLYTVKERLPRRTVAYLGRPWIDESGQWFHQADDILRTVHLLNRSTEDGRGWTSRDPRHLVQEMRTIMQQLWHVSQDLDILPASRHAHVFECMCRMVDIYDAPPSTERFLEVPMPEIFVQLKGRCINLVILWLLEVAPPWMRGNSTEQQQSMSS
eukprot:TRINITY_DN7044_c0_g1_i2.p1 TRINITY_DN7044_c0_g1~~TRINITY_DN7044_c0_g1_i2.p1  ORF type:complete len:611 (+),score=94.42 TRINITY_DN7044_c0_g1_i2:34-1833(+)